MASEPTEKHTHQAVRFKSEDEEIGPSSPAQPIEATTSSGDAPPEQLSPEAEEELRNQIKSLQTSRLQAKRMENFVFEPVSLPVSRVPSNSSSIHHTPAQSGRSTPRVSPPASAIHSPPLTPAGSASREVKPSPGGTLGTFNNGRNDPAVLTPQDSPPREPENQADRRISAAAQARLSANSVIRPKSMIEMSGPVPSHPKLPPSFNVGPAGDSQPPSVDVSPVNTPGANTPGTSTPILGPPYSRPFTPAGDANDPYARSRRPPQSKNLDAIDPRFIFGARDSRKGHSHSSSTSAPRSRGSGSDLRGFEDKQRHSFFGGSYRKQETEESSSPISTKPHHGSMSELKRFFKLGSSKKDKPSSRAQSPSGSIKHQRASRTGTRTPPSNTPSSVNVPFADDHGLESKYGKFGKVLGSGAGGSVRLMKRSSDGVTFAVKQFRARHAYESERDYNKKVTAEFCIGSTLHHGNIIETMDIIQEKGNWYEVMEFAPFDLFATVMTGKMTREEVTCATLQILNGVTYLHSMGLAHRDLKLDNVVINEHGIMKIIDFGSAVVFRYPFETDVVLASGIVGSDPYLAPEVYDLPKYDPQPTDIWSIAIIFCCMTLRRFPWKAPRLSDNSYKLFVSEPNDGGPRPKSMVDLSSAGREGGDKHHHHHSSNEPKSDPATRNADDGKSSSAASVQQPTQQPSSQSIKGPWRLLRLLPRETRNIVGRMLEVDPKKRATLEEILQDPWVSQSQVCRQEEGGLVIRAPGHEHHLEPGSSPSSEPSKSSK